MSEAARLYDHVSPTAQATHHSWAGEPHGEIGAMYRAIEQRLAAESFALAVIPLPGRPAEKILARLSRVAGWLVLAGVALGLMIVLAALVALLD